MELTIPLAAQVILEIPISFSDEDSNSGSDSEEEIMVMLIRKKKLRTPQRIENYVEKIIPGYTSKEFQQHFRVTVDAYEQLLRLVGPQLLRHGVTGRPTINVEKQLLAVIWLLATPDSYRSVGERFNLAKASLSQCFMRVVKVLNALGPTLIKWPEGEKLHEVERKFYSIARVPGVIGAVDGTYIEIKAPQEDPQSYITRKCRYAFTLQAIAEPSLKFTDAFIGYPGSVSDTRIFKNSDIYGAVRTNMGRYFPNDEYIIGDKAYPCLDWCISPYINRGHLTQAQTHFNRVHAKTRQVVERAFALLVGRFRRLKYLDMNCLNVIPGTVLAACVLHNLCLDFRDLLIEDYIRQGINDVVPNDDDDNVADFGLDDGRRRRDELCRQIYQQRNN